MVVLFTGQEVERISIKLSESLNYKITSRPLLTKKKGKMHFYYTYQNLSYSYSPHSNERNDFFCRLFKICGKRTQCGLVATFG